MSEYCDIAIIDPGLIPSIATHAPRIEQLPNGLVMVTFCIGKNGGRELLATAEVIMPLIAWCNLWTDLEHLGSAVRMLS